MDSNSPELSRLIEELCDSYLKSEDLGPIGVVARKYRLLPLYGDSGGVYFLSKEGRVLSYAWDSELPPSQERDPALVVAAMVAAAEKYPRLSCLLPNRPSTALNCHACNGLGTISFMETQSARCGVCGGLGWLDRGRTYDPATR